MEDNEEQEQKPPLARWVGVAEPASLSTKTGGQRFVVTIKLPEKSLKTASNLVKEVNDALKNKSHTTRGCKLTAQFVLIDSERARLQRATASFSTFKEAQTCLRLLKELGLPTSDISAEFEDFGKKKYDPWYESVSQAWWPWFAAWRNPPPEMPMMKVKNRLDVTEGGKYKVGADGKLGKSDDVDRSDEQRGENESGDKNRSNDKPRDVDDQVESKPRRKKKKKVDEEEQSGE